MLGEMLVFQDQLAAAELPLWRAYRAAHLIQNMPSTHSSHASTLENRMSSLYRVMYGLEKYALSAALYLETAATCAVAHVSVCVIITTAVRWALPGDECGLCCCANECLRECLRECVREYYYCCTLCSIWRRLWLVLLSE
jgi:hypothetical protein